jgi:hypothetical protein
MKKMILTTILLGTVMFANNNYNSYEATYKKLTSLSDENMHKIIDADINYKMATSYMFDDEKMISKTVDASDPEAIIKKPMPITIKVPNVPEALKYYEKSVDATSNPIAAYSGIYLINKFIGMKQFKYMEKFKKFASVLYNDKNRTCQAYLFYGEIFEKGIDNKIDLKKANEIFELGIKDELCKSSWESNVMASKSWTIKRELNKIKKD